MLHSSMSFFTADPDVCSCFILGLCPVDVKTFTADHLSVLLDRTFMWRDHRHGVHEHHRGHRAEYPGEKYVAYQ
jgi:hypothetical protein